MQGSLTGAIKNFFKDWQYDITAIQKGNAQKYRLQFHPQSGSYEILKDYSNLALISNSQVIKGTSIIYVPGKKSNKKLKPNDYLIPKIWRPYEDYTIGKEAWKVKIALVEFDTQQDRFIVSMNFDGIDKFIDPHSLRKVDRIDAVDLKKTLSRNAIGPLWELYNKSSENGKAGHFSIRSSKKTKLADNYNKLRNRGIYKRIFLGDNHTAVIPSSEQLYNIAVSVRADVCAGESRLGQKISVDKEVNDAVRLIIAQAPFIKNEPEIHCKTCEQLAQSVEEKYNLIQEQRDRYFSGDIYRMRTELEKHARVLIIAQGDSTNLDEVIVRAGFAILPRILNLKGPVIIPFDQKAFVNGELEVGLDSKFTIAMRHYPVLQGN